MDGSYLSAKELSSSRQVRLDGLAIGWRGDFRINDGYKAWGLNHTSCPMGRGVWSCFFDSWSARKSVGQTVQDPLELGTSSGPVTAGDTYSLPPPSSLLTIPQYLPYAFVTGCRDHEMCLSENSMSIWFMAFFLSFDDHQLGVNPPFSNKGHTHSILNYHFGGLNHLFWRLHNGSQWFTLRQQGGPATLFKRLSY